jgi:hypothetical protein
LLRVRKEGWKKTYVQEEEQEKEEKEAHYFWGRGDDYRV